MNQEPMIPILAGFLAGHVLKTGHELMKVTHVAVDPPDAFRVKFASGLVLRVKVDQVDKPAEAT